MFNKYLAIAGCCLLAGKLYAQQDTVKHLQEVNVVSKYYRKYKVDNVSASLKLLTPVLGLPQNVQEIDKSILSDQQVLNINEGVTRNVSGAMRNNTADFYSPLIFMRGAAINTLRNGTDLSMIYYGPMPEDAALIDRVEFVKGPAGFMNAIGDPAGAFNIVTKQPAGHNANQVNITLGSFDLYRLSGDFEDGFDKKGKWQYRLNVAGQKSRSFQHFAFNDKVIIDPVLKYNVNDHSYISLEYIHQQQQFLQYLLTVFTPHGFNSLPEDFSIADPGKDPVKARENNLFATYYNKLNDNWQLTAKVAFARDYLDGNYFFVSKYDAANPALLQRRVTYERFNTRVYSFQTYVNGMFNTGTVIHKVLAGIDANRKELLAYSGYNDPAANQTLYPLDVNNPVYGISFDSNRKEGRLSDIATNKQMVSYYAVYAQDELNLLKDKLKLTVAARLTSSESKIEVPKYSNVTDLVLTPRLGLNYAIRPDFSAYALYDQTFTPQSGISAAGGAFQPLKGKNTELGLKKDWAQGKWNTTVSVYHIVRDNIIVSDPVTNLQSQIGQTKTKGVEFDLKGEVAKGLNVVLNYAYTDSHISDDANKKYVNLSTPYRVRHIQNTWLNYKLPFKATRGIAISAGYQLQAGRAGRYPQDGNLDLSDIFRVDGGIGWTARHLSINGIVNNVFNRRNYGSAWTRPTGLYAYVPLAPREIRLSVGYNF